jgi:uncharacterized membrane protein
MCLSHLFLGSLLLFGFFAVVRRRRYHHHSGRGCDSSSCGSCDAHACNRWDDGRGHHRGHHHRRSWGRDDAGPSWLSLMGLGGRLSPDERRAVEDAIREVAPSMRKARRDMAGALGDVVSAFEKEGFDVDVAGDLLAKNRDALDAVTNDLLAALGKLHGEIDADRRRDLARALSSVLQKMA